jgi:flagellar operon protein
MSQPLNVAGLARAAAQPAAAKATQPAVTGAPAFAEVLDAARQVKFTNHAQKRLDTRNIAMDETRTAQLAEAVDRAAARGGKESLVLMDDLAFIVNVADRLVITALDDPSRREGVFTNIDSVVLAYKPQ